jgi:hypothetical protein
LFASRLGFKSEVLESERRAVSDGRRLRKLTKQFSLGPITLLQLLGLPHRRSQRSYQLGSFGEHVNVRRALCVEKLTAKLARH